MNRRNSKSVKSTKTRHSGRKTAKTAKAPKRGFAAMSLRSRREIAGKGGRARKSA